MADAPRSMLYAHLPVTVARAPINHAHPPITSAGPSPGNARL